MDRQRGRYAAVGNVAEPGASPSNVSNEDHLFQMLLSGYTWAEAAWSSLTQVSYVDTVIGDPLMTWTRLPPVPSTVVSRLLFYDNSAFDGNVAGPGALDNAAISNKVALLPGTPAFATTAQALSAASNYDKGINGLMVDLRHSHGNHAAINLASLNNDFHFRIGTDDGQGEIVWTDATAHSFRRASRPHLGAVPADRIAWN